MAKWNFSKEASCRPNVYYFPVKEVFATLALSFLYDNKTVFTSCKQG